MQVWAKKTLQDISPVARKCLSYMTSILMTMKRYTQLGAHSQAEQQEEKEEIRPKAAN